MAGSPSGKPLFLFAPGAGAPSSSDWMRAWAARLGTLGPVFPFDYPYMKSGRGRPDPQSTLVAAHRQALADARAAHGDGAPVVLAGKSMGSRMGCHLSVDLAAMPATPARPVALVCFGYPLRSGATGALRDQVLCALTTPVLFLQGTKDALCPLDDLDAVRKRMTAPSTLFVVPGGDHSLKVGVRDLRASGKTQDDWDRAVLEAVTTFLRQHGALVPT